MTVFDALAATNAKDRAAPTLRSRPSSLTSKGSARVCPISWVRSRPSSLTSKGSARVCPISWGLAPSSHLSFFFLSLSLSACGWVVPPRSHYQFFLARVRHSANIPTHMRWLTTLPQCDRTGEHSSVNSASTPAPTVGTRLAATFCSAATVTATATAAADVPHRKRSQDRQVWRQRISELDTDHIRAVLGTRQAGIAAALKWAEQRRDNAIDAATVTSAHIMEAADNEALHAYIFVHAAGEPRSIVK